mgnify:CR=1 FL=1
MAYKTVVDDSLMTLQQERLDVVGTRYRRSNCVGAAVTRGTIYSLMSFGIPVEHSSLFKLELLTHMAVIAPRLIEPR